MVSGLTVSEISNALGFMLFWHCSLICRTFSHCVDQHLMIATRAKSKKTTDSMNRIACLTPSVNIVHELFHVKSFCVFEFFLTAQASGALLCVPIHPVLISRYCLLWVVPPLGSGL